MGRRVTLAVGTALAGVTAAALGACGSIPERPEPGPSTTTASPSEPGETANVQGSGALNLMSPSIMSCMSGMPLRNCRVRSMPMPNAKPE